MGCRPLCQLDGKKLIARIPIKRRWSMQVDRNHQLTVVVHKPILESSLKAGRWAKFC